MCPIVVVDDAVRDEVAMVVDADVDVVVVDVVAKPGGSCCSNAVKAGEAIVNFS